MKKLSIVKIILRVLFSLIFLGLAIWFILPMRVAIFDIGNLLGLFLSICGLAVSVFWNKFKSICKKISSRKLGKCILVIITSLVTIGVSYVVVISGFMIAAALKAPNENSTVIVLGCKVNGKNPSLMLSKRLEAAYEYLNENKNAVCIVSGGKGSNEEISEAQCMYNYLTEKGIASDRIIMEDESTTTSENLEFSKKIIEEKGYNRPTPIQQQAIPVALSRKDILGCAQTGTGKTASFAIPIIQLLQADPIITKRKGVKALILTPTRELALQISECLDEYARYTPVRHGVMFGGVNQRPQVTMLQKGIDILVATPGRLLDLMSQGFLSLDQVKYFVLDEADRMLDMGFIHDIKRILPKLPKEKQTLFFSATMPDSIVTLASALLKNPVKITITPESPTVDAIEQFVYFVEKAEKGRLLISLLRKAENQSVLVFSRTKHNADRIVRVLGKAGIGSQAIHGNKSQAARQSALGNFKSGKTRVMVATDIAARGIDINELPLVINYDLPDVPETYVHRIGRTGRAGNAGTAFTFCSQEERKLVDNIQKLTGKKLCRAEVSA